MISRLYQFDVRRALLFLVYASVTTVICQWSDTLAYLAPFIASAALLANVGDQLKKTLVATAVVYATCILFATLASYLMPINLFGAVLGCGVGYLICLSLSQQHPPAMALLFVLIMRPPTVAENFGLVVAVSGLLIVGIVTPIMMLRRVREA